MSKTKSIVKYYPFGLSVGSVIAMLTSWFHFGRVVWLIPAGVLGWFYVIYHLLRYGYLQR